MKPVPQARRSTFTPALGKRVLQRIAEGESLSKICGPDRAAGMPARLTVYNWLARYPHFRRAYLLARMAQSELYADEVIEIADICEDSEDSLNRWRRDRIRMEARRWRVGRLSPEVYVKGLEVVEREALEAASDEGRDDNHLRDYRRPRHEPVATRIEALL